MYLEVQPAEAGTLEKLTELVGVILEDSVRVLTPEPPDFPALQSLLSPEFRFLLSRGVVQRAVEALYRLPYPDRQRVYEAFQNDTAFFRHIDDDGYRLSDLAASSRNGYAALKDLCGQLYDIVAKGDSEPRESGGELYSSGLLRQRFREHNGRFGRMCPVCIREVFFSQWEGDVDHYFPRSTHPALSFHPYNLLPICTDCNGPKNKFFWEPVDPKDAGPGELRTVFLPYLRSASREVELGVRESRDAKKDLKIVIRPGPGGDRWTQRRIENMDRLYNLSNRWSGILEGVYGDVEDECWQRRREGVSQEEWPADLRRILSAAAGSTKDRYDLIKGVYCSWLLEQSDAELLKKFPYRTLSLPPEGA